MQSAACEVVDLLSKNCVQNPYDFFKFLREELPLCQLADGTYVLSRYEDVKFALKRHDVFSSGWSDSPIIHPDWLGGEAQRGRFMAEADPPEHTKHRAIVNRAFVEKAVKALVPEMQVIAATLVEKIRAIGGSDFLEAFSYPYVAQVSDAITGLGMARVKNVRQWVEMAESFSMGCPNKSVREKLARDVEEQNRYYDSLIEGRRKKPESDLITRLVDANIDGAPLTNSQLRGALNLFTLGGFEAPGQMVANAVIKLANDGGLFFSLREHNELIPSFVEELLRLHNPAQGSIRTTKTDVTVSGGVVPKGAKVLALIGSANRDELQFREPDLFILGRENIKSHLGFGQGAHVCIGESLARWQLRVAVASLVNNFNRIECLPFERQVWTSTLVGRMLKTLPAKFYSV